MTGSDAEALPLVERRVAEVAASDPDKVALVHSDGSSETTITYAELDNRANQQHLEPFGGRHSGLRLGQFRDSGPCR